MQPRTRPPRRRGNVLVLFAGLSFAFLALAALAVDTGFALLTQKQMNIVADAAALEGLRKRDDPAVDNRQQARQIAGYYARFTPAGGKPLQYGTGPNLASGGRLTVGTPASLAGQLQPNEANNPQGDMVSGTFDPSSRNFQPDAPGTPQASAGSAFLVRLRRTGEAPVAGEVSAGPRVPYLLGRGSMLGAEAKAKGIAVRSTSIADARNAMAVGVADAAHDLDGATLFALSLAAWKKLQPGDSLDLNAAVASGDVRSLAAGNAVVGQPVPGAGLTIDPANVARYRYVALFIQVGTTDRVIGFGRVQVTGGDDPTLTKQAGIVAPENASALPTKALPPDVDVPALMQAYTAFTDNPVKAPALVR